MKPATLYVVVRADLAPGLQMAQAIHAQRLFVAEHPEVERVWFEESNTISVVHAADEEALLDVRARAGAKGIPASLFEEPDLGGEATALTLAPSLDSVRLCRKLRAAFSGLVVQRQNTDL